MILRPAADRGRRRTFLHTTRSLRAAVFAALLTVCAGAGSPAESQVPPPRQEPPRPQRDTLPAGADSLAADTIPGAGQDTVVAPAIQFPALPLSPYVSPAGTEWVWTREMLLREAYVDLVDLLERIPGVTGFRAGSYVQPLVAAGFGGTAGRTEVVIDGYIVGPLSGTTLDLSQIALGNLREVRVQRRLGLLRIILTTAYPVEGQPYTRVEAGIGVPAANMFRGLFLVPHVIIGPLALGIERLDTQGTAGNEPAGLFSGWAKWAWTDGTRGVQLEWLRGTLRREPNSPWVLDRVRQDFIVRARNRFSSGLVAEVFAGHASLEETVPPPADSEDEEALTERSLVQAGVRAGLQLPWASLSSSVRYRSFEDIPVGTAELELETAAGPLRVSADAAVSSWDGSSASHAGLRAELGGLLRSPTRAGASVFGEITRGTRGAPAFDNPLHDGYILSYRNGWRAGAALDLGRASGSIALLSMEQDWAWPFGLAFDRAAAPRPLGTARGLEARGSVVIWPDLLTLSSWITDWREAEGWTYLPSRSWRTALELHTLPLPSGNLEIFGRAEAHMRGSVLAFDAAALDGAGEYTRLPAYTTADAYLQIRVIAVRAFIRWEDVLGEVEELPGRIQRGPRIFYGVKWDLWN